MQTSGNDAIRHFAYTAYNSVENMTKFYFKKNLRNTTKEAAAGSILIVRGVAYGSAKTTSRQTGSYLLLESVLNTTFIKERFEIYTTTGIN